MRQSAPASQPRKPEPAGPHGSTVPEPRSRTPAAELALAVPVSRSGIGEAPETTGRPGRGCPYDARRAGRTKTSNDTSALTGLPGRQTTAVSPYLPEPWGMPGCMATLVNSTPRGPSASLTTS